MSEEIYTVEQFAERLKLHRKTVLRFIREGRLRAVKVGKSYRILRSDIEAMTGGIRRALPARARVTSIVDLTDIEPGVAQHLARALPAMRMGQEAPADPMRVDVVHDPEQRQVKVVIVGSPADVSAMLRMIHILTEG